MSSPSHFGSAARGNSSSGFTLIESLSVLVIVAVLLALIFPGIRAARNHALMAVCMGNERTIYSGLAAYASENNGHFPMIESYLNGVYGSFWSTSIASYLNIPTSGGYAGTAFHCPADPVPSSFSYAATVVGTPTIIYYPWGIYVNYTGYFISNPPETLMRMRHPNSTVILAERGGIGSTLGQFYPYDTTIAVINQSHLGFLHGDYMNCLYGDGHVETISVQNYNADVTTTPPKKPFVYQP